MKTRATVGVTIGVVLYLCFSCAFAADLSSVQWHSGITASEMQRAKIVRIAPGFHAADLAQLHDDQMIETPSGHRMAVGRLRAIRQAFSEAKARVALAGPAVQLKVFPRPSKPCTPLKPGETMTQILARPSDDVVCSPSGKSMSVQQLRSLVAFMQHYHLGERRATSGAPRSLLSGPEIRVANNDQVMAALKHAPDSTVLVSSSGLRVTVGELKAFFAAHTRTIKMPTNSRPPGVP